VSLNILNYWTQLTAQGSHKINEQVSQGSGMRRTHACLYQTLRGYAAPRALRSVAGRNCEGELGEQTQMQDGFQNGWKVLEWMNREINPPEIQTLISPT
jgi:hypothetical protein